MIFFCNVSKYKLLSGNLIEDFFVKNRCLIIILSQGNHIRFIKMSFPLKKNVNLWVFLFLFFFYLERIKLLWNWCFSIRCLFRITVCGFSFVSPEKQNTFIMTSLQNSIIALASSNKEFFSCISLILFLDQNSKQLMVGQVRASSLTLLCRDNCILASFSSACLLHVLTYYHNSIFWKTFLTILKRYFKKTYL